VTGGGETSAEAIEDLRRAILSEENVERAGTEAGIILADGRKSEFVQRVRSATRIDVATVDESQEVITIAIHGRSQSRVSALAAALARNCATDGETAGAALQPRMEPNATATRFNVRLALAGLVATFGLSLFAGVASAALARWRDTTFHSLAEARAHFQIPVLGAVPLTGPAASDS
jgi:capsular polysaccharide biosynthesis protein